LFVSDAIPQMLSQARSYRSLISLLLFLTALFFSASTRRAGHWISVAIPRTRNACQS